jgi:hypothetical protein
MFEFNFNTSTNHMKVTILYFTLLRCGLSSSRTAAVLNISRNSHLKEKQACRPVRSAFFVIERTGTAFQHLFSTDFQSFNPMSDENWTKLWNLLRTFALNAIN